MPLLAYNKTVTPVVLAAGAPARTLPASLTPGVKGPGVNVTSESKGLTGPQYAALEVQRMAGTIALVWIGAVDYATPGCFPETEDTLPLYSTAGRPPAAAVGGLLILNTTSGALNVSDGSVWRDALGALA